MNVETDRRRPGVQLPGCTVYKVHAHLPCHTLDGSVVTDGISELLNQHLGEGWYGLVVFRDGYGLFAGDDPDTPPPDAERMHVMLDVCRALNSRLSAKGHWIAACHKEGNLAFYWRDKHSVCHLEYGVSDAWERVRHYKIDDFLNAAAQCMQETADLIDELQLQILFRERANSILSTTSAPFRDN